jgi:ParB/RepB/Spo0J family partition protein
MNTAGFSKRAEEALSRILDKNDVTEGNDQVTDCKVTMIDIEHIIPNPSQPRRDFQEETLTALTGSIKDHGVMMPLIVNKLNDSSGGYKLIAGERRLRAAKMAGLTQVPAIIKEVEDKDVNVLALVENLQREDLNVVEKILGIGKLCINCDDTEATAKALRLSRRSVERYVRIYKTISVSESLLGLFTRDGATIDFRGAEKIADLVRNLEVEELGKFLELADREGLKHAVRSFGNHLKARPVDNEIISSIKETDTEVHLHVRYVKGIVIDTEERLKLHLIFQDFFSRVTKTEILIV